MIISLTYISARRLARKLGPDGLAERLGVDPNAPGLFRAKLAGKYSLRYRKVEHRVAPREGVMQGFLDYDEKG